MLCAGIYVGSQMIASRGRYLYLGLIITWVGPFALLLWWARQVDSGRLVLTSCQESFIPVHHRLAIDVDVGPHCAPDSIPVACRHSGSEKRDLGD